MHVGDPLRGCRAAAMFAALAFVPWAAGCGASSTSSAGDGSSFAPNVSKASASSRPDKLPDDAELQKRVEETIKFTGERELISNRNAAWQVVHGILAYGPELPMKVGDKSESALDYLMAGGQLTGWILRPGEKGVDTVVESGSKTGQGHEDQWLGYMSLHGVPLDRELIVGGGRYKMGDLLSQAQWDIRDGMEATWTLMALAAYAPTDTTWKARDGSEWSVGRVVEMEARQDIAASACGGTHRLTGLTTALNRRLAEGKPIEGPWKLAQDQIDRFVETAQQFQQPDGAFSASYFQRASSTADIGQRIGTTGHTLEFLALTLTDEELRQPWVTRAVVALCDMLEQTRDFDLECGGLYHAARGLQVYNARRFTKAPIVGQPPPAGSVRPARSSETAAR